MIASVSGILAERNGDTIIIRTDGGVGYAITVPLGVFERLPAPGNRVSLHTELVVREDGWFLFGFDQPAERAVFQQLLGASGFGPRLALALLSTLGPGRTVRSIRQRDIAALSSVSGIGKKKAERLILELYDKFKDLEGGPVAEATPAGPGEEAVRGLVRLGYTQVQSEEAVRGALADGAAQDTAQLMRRALQGLAATRGGSR